MRQLATPMLGLILLALHGCDRSPDGALKGHGNTKFVFHGLVVDQDGIPLQGARFEFVVESFPDDWTFKSRGHKNTLKTVEVVSDLQGRFKIEETGCVIRRKKAERVGYRHFYDLDHDVIRSFSNYYFSIISWGDLCYRNDRDSPAVFVFVKDGIRQVTALPSRGGESSGNGTHWQKNEPGWPIEPSLEDVARKVPTTSSPSAPTTAPSSR
jgi:hypothetical protein